MAPVLVSIRDWDLRDFVRGALEQAGYDVITAATPDAAQYVLTSSPPPRAVVVSAVEGRDERAVAPNMPVVGPIATPATWGKHDADANVRAVNAHLAMPVADPR